MVYLLKSNFIFLYIKFIYKKNCTKKNTEKQIREQLRQLIIVNILKFKNLIIFFIKFKFKFYKLIQTI